MKTLPVQDLRESDYAKLLADIDALLWANIYKPIIDLVRPSLPKVIQSGFSPRNLRDASPAELRNALSAEGAEALKKALKDGSVQMVRDAQTGRILFIVPKPDRRVSDGLRDFGAKLDKRTGNWSCDPTAVPQWVRDESRQYTDKSKAVHDSAKALIGDLKDKIKPMIEKANLFKASEHAINQITGGWKAAAKGIQMGTPELGTAGQAALAAGFERTRSIQIKSPGSTVSLVQALDTVTKESVFVWAQEALDRLRREVDENASAGYRSAGLAERIRNEYGVSRGRADLIARQETDNFMSNYRMAKAADAGLKRYMWKIVGDSRTRPDHKRLHNRIFRYDQPPVTDLQTGARNNPGQDFRCRCRDATLLE